MFFFNDVYPRRALGVRDSTREGAAKLALEEENLLSHDVGRLRRIIRLQSTYVRPHRRWTRCLTV